MKYNINTAWRLGIALLVLALFVAGEATAAVMIAPVGAADLEEMAQKMSDAKGRFDNTVKELKEGHEELTRKMTEQGTKISSELKKAIDDAITNFNEKFGTFSNDLAALDQKMAGARDSGQPEEGKSWGEQFIGSEDFKSRIGVGEQGTGSKFRGTISAEIKQVNSVAAGGLIRSQRENDVVALLRERRVVRDLLRTVPVNTSSVDYVTQTTRTNNAAPVAEGTTKPYSEYAWGSATVVVRTLAHLAKITRQAMDDAPRLMSEIDGEMRYGLGFVEEHQFLFGSGVGQNLLGIMPQATAFALPAGFARRNGTTKIDVLRIAMLQNAIALLPADGIVLHEVDWADIELTKTTDGAYLFAQPQGSVSPRMWALPVVATPAMTAGDFLVGNFTLGANVYDRMGVEVLLSTENADDFETNRATMRAEERVAIAVKRPQAFTKGTFSTAITAVNLP
jgi:HK97 family phage major capsid protein